MTGNKLRKIAKVIIEKDENIKISKRETNTFKVIVKTYDNIGVTSLEGVIEESIMIGCKRHGINTMGIDVKEIR